MGRRSAAPMELEAFLPPHLLAALARPGGAAPPPRVDRFPAALLFSDIAGFTALTEALEARGRAGAEEIVKVINAAFAPAMATIDREGGSIVTFGGDALFTLFEGPGRATRACRAAEEIREHFRQRGEVETSAGPVMLSVSQAVHHGTVLGLHLGTPERRLHVVAGRGVEALARAEARAAGGAIAVSRTARAQRASESRESGTVRSAPGVPPPALLLPYLPDRVRGLTLPFEGEFRRAAILFLETRGLATRRLQQFVLALQDALDLYGGILLSTDLSGSGLRWLCAFGAPAAHEDDPDRAARAALDLLRACPRGMALRGGLHVGTGAHIQMGSASRSSLELMGDVTNTAARALAQASWGEVLASDAAGALLSGVELEARGARTVKGKAAPIGLHALRASRPAARRISVRAPMIGRDAELHTIVAALEGLVSGAGTAISVRGDAGLGKSRLKYEARRIARGMGIPVHEGRAIGFGGMPYAAIAALIGDALELPGTPSSEEVVAAAAAAAQRLRLSALQRDHLASLLGARESGSPLEQLPPRDVRRNAMEATVALFRSLAAGAPRLLVLEDMHWADGGSVEAAERLARASGEARFVLLLLHRPGYEPPEGASRIQLGELPDDAVAALAAAHLGEVPAAVGKLVRERAGGNPFYVEEVARHLLESRILRRTGDGYELLRDPRPEDLPASLESLIAARLDRLSSGGKQVAQLAAVIGRSFPLQLLVRLARDERTAASALEELSARELVFEKSSDPLEYIWKHAITRDVAYAGILGGKRRALHRSVADAIEGVFADRLDAFTAMLGFHREQADQREEAQAAYLAGARRAVRSHAHEEAAMLYGKYAALVRVPTAETIGARIELGHKVLALQGRLKEAEAIYRTCIEEARAVGSRVREAESLRCLGILHRQIGRSNEAIAVLGEALAIDHATGDRRGEGIDRCCLGKVHHEQGRVELAQTLFREALALARETRDRWSESTALTELSSLCQELGRLEEARALLEQAGVIDLEIGDRLGHAIGLGNLANLHAAQGRTREATALVEEALVVARQVGARRVEGALLGNLANYGCDLGHRQEARLLYAQALAIHREVGDRRFVGIVLGNLSSLLVDEGSLDQARELALESLAIHRTLGNRREEGIALGTMACFALFDGDLELATNHCRDAAAALSEVDDPTELGKVLCVGGHVALAAGSGAAEPLRRVREMALPDPDVTFVEALQRLERAQSLWESGGSLVAGRCAADLTPGQASWFRSRST